MARRAAGPAVDLPLVPGEPLVSTEEPVGPHASGPGVTVWALDEEPRH